MLFIKSIMKKAYFITGTDTGVGKTLVACALLQAFVKQGDKAVGMKPVAAGCMETPAGLCCEDVESLRAAGNVVASRELVNPYALISPVAPHIAAERAGVEVSLEQIDRSFRQLREMADVTVVEGVGGFVVPLNARQDTADMAEMLGLPVILVVGMRLGCINHALLTAQAIRHKGLRLVAWVANRIDPDMSAFDENLHALETRLAAPLLGIIPYQAEVSSAPESGLMDLNILNSSKVK
ncbi:dethiobiotin synthase [Sulfuricella sp.]|uniref:dethiobiotin synthase n=1 Tax=Sulfuricella sp. TaxID=2099377 RepID=UPI002B92E441|nr:dethiobiotin synthase [Sulfuricella sp.]HUX62485.1 dethiobiotin synthase [Sulfuricella sp.]